MTKKPWFKGKHVGRGAYSGKDIHKANAQTVLESLKPKKGTSMIIMGPHLIQSLALLDVLRSLVDDPSNTWDELLYRKCEAAFKGEKWDDVT